MSVRDPVPLGTPSQAYIQTYSSGLEAPAGSVFTANVSTPSINTSSITLAGSGSRIVGDATSLGPGINFLTNDFQIYSASGTTQYLDMGQGVGAYAGSTFFNFGDLNNPATAYITAGNYWTYFPQVGAIPAGAVVTSNISTVSAVASTITSKYITASTMATSSILGDITVSSSITTNNVSTININLSTINNTPYPLPGLTPTGAITIWAGGLETTTSQNFNPPTGWLVCDGSIIYQSIYGALYAVIGTKYGGAPPIPNTAYLPDLTFAVPMGTPKKPFAATPGITDRVIQMDANSWRSDYAPQNISTIQTWKIQNVQGGTLNYGTLINDVGVTGGGVVFPKMYVSTILNFSGNPADTGYIIVRSVDNVTPIPVVPTTSTIQVNYAYGVLDTPAAGTDAPYALGTYNVEGHPFTTHNQTLKEVSVHDHLHSFNYPDPSTPGNGYVGYQEQFTTTSGGGGGSIAYLSGALRAPDYIATSPAPISPVTVGVNNTSTISSFQVSAVVPGGYANPTNIGTYIAPNFINMVYIIKY
jgi:hypothetical protein